MLSHDTPERWLPVVGYEGLYIVSDSGRVENARTGYCLKPQLKIWGYLHVTLYKAGARRFTIHSLVLAAFVGPRPDGLVIDHRNNDRTDNRLANLEYVTTTDNIRKARDAGRAYVGILNGRAKLTETDVRAIRSLSETRGDRDLAILFHVSPALIHAVRTYRVWKHVA